MHRENLRLISIALAQASENTEVQSTRSSESTTFGTFNALSRWGREERTDVFCFALLMIGYERSSGATAKRLPNHARMPTGKPMLLHSQVSDPGGGTGEMGEKAVARRL